MRREAHLQEQRRIWRRFQRYLATGSTALPESCPPAEHPSPEPPGLQHARSLEQDLTARLSATVAAAVADLAASLQMPADAAQKLPGVQAIKGRPRKGLPHTARFSSAAALPLAAAWKASGGPPAPQLAQQLAAALSPRQVMLQAAVKLKLQLQAAVHLTLPSELPLGCAMTAQLREACACRLAAEHADWHVTADNCHLNFHSSSWQGGAQPSAGEPAKRASSAADSMEATAAALPPAGEDMEQDPLQGTSSCSPGSCRQAGADTANGSHNEFQAHGSRRPTGRHRRGGVSCEGLDTAHRASEASGAASAGASAWDFPEQCPADCQQVRVLLARLQSGL